MSSYHAFASVLGIIQQTVEQSTEGQRTHSGHETRKNTGSTTKRASSGDRLPSHRKRLKRGSSPGNDANEMVCTEQDENTAPDARKTVDCIIYKHNLLKGTPHLCPCSGFTATSMANLRHSHLMPAQDGKQGRARNHNGLMTSLYRCNQCKEDSVNKEVILWHKAKKCKYKTQARTDSVEARWARLYLARYPDETRIPSPCKSSSKSQHEDSLLIPSSQW